MSAAKINATKGVKNNDIIIAFMGPTGAGKSYFVDLLTGQRGQRAKTTVKSVTQDIEATRMEYPYAKGRNIILVDTPGFNDATRSDMQILKMISDWLQKTYERNIKLSGLIYLHRIIDNRMAGAPYKNLRMFGELCGDTPMSQVVLVTTMWERLFEPPGTGEAREEVLKNDFWKPLIDKGSTVRALKKAAPEDAWHIVSELVTRRIEKEKEVVLLQEEMVDKGIALNETHAGQALYNDYQKRLAAQKNRMESVLAHAEESNDEKLKKELKKEYEKLQREFDETFIEAEKLKRSLLQKFISVFRPKRTKANAIKVPSL